MFQLAILLHLLESLGIKVPKCKAPSAKQIETVLKGFEKVFKFIVGIIMVLWILMIIAIKHLLKVIWEFK